MSVITWDGEVNFPDLSSCVCFLWGYMQTCIYAFTDPSSAQVGLIVKFVMKRSKLQFATKPNQ